jgi:trimethylamine--corrinoid protein Co-methyltransferase
MGSIESGLMNAAVTQMAHYYRLPCYVTVGVADSKIPDAQAAYESAATCMLAALAGGNFIHQAFGFLDGALTISYGQFVIDNDIVGSCLRTLRGIETNPETLAFDVIASVGPGGNFLAQKHTVEYMRTESYRPRVSNYQDYQSWLNAGGKDSWEKAEEIVSKLLSEPPRQFIPEEIDEQIRSRFPELVEPTKAS